MNWFFYILAAPLLVGVVGAIYFRRKLASSATPNLLRAQILAIATLLWMVSFGIVLVRGHHRGDPVTLWQFLSVSAYVLVLGLNLYQIRKIWPQARAEKLKLRRQTKSPAFFWQGALILLPLLALTGLGIVSIIRERRVVEDEAHTRAREIMEQLSGQIGRLVAGELSNFEGVANYWRSFYECVSAWPGSQQQKACLPDRENFSNRVNGWRTNFPNLEPSEVFPCQITFAPDGELLSPIQSRFPPQPSKWFSDLSDDQRTAWLAIQSAPLPKLDDLQKHFFETNPGKEAKWNAQFVSLRARSQIEPVSALTWLNFAERSGDTPSEAGIPLSNLAFARALKQADQFDEKLWERLVYELLRIPSAVTPELFRRAQAIAQTDELKASVKNLEMLWLADERLREVAQAIQQTGKIQGVTTTNLWVSARETKWFCVLNPWEQITWTVQNQTNISVTNQSTSARLFPESAIASAFQNAIAKIPVSVPRYFGFTVELEGEPVHLLPVDQQSEPLATMTASLSQPARMLREPSKAGEPLATSGDEFESLPSHPKFTLSIVLADRALLYSQHRQRTFWLLGLIACAAFASLAGLISARRAFYRQLRLNELKSNFVSSVSHELRAPIASVRLLAESLERGRISEPQKQNEYFKFIVQECRRLSSLIENVLDFSRIEQGRKEYEFEPTDIVKLVRETAKLMEPYATERNVRLEVQLDDAQLSTLNLQPLLDGHAIQQALVNLIDNAIKHSADGALVRIGLDVLPTSCRQKGSADKTSGKDLPDRGKSTPELPTGCRQHVQIFVEDSGPGIPTHEHEKIFDRFYRLGSELRRETQGVGIGLSIVKHIAEAHGGKVLVQSEVGKGTRFTIEIPNRNETSNNQR